ncbi:unnamed protein product [Cuscuta europaea]|uniref:Reverse transcriptase Ty1/copia-type domain-containing protein n=1 Tax=Cuscuta europaea TaxID=41803 RepID=A0A9P1E1V7_CUSEU|nr:unnamed protein product [Cuscuta europaea]
MVDSGNPYYISHYVNYNPFSVAHRAFLAAISVHKEPENFKEAVCDPLWKAAMQREIDALEQTGTWAVQDLPKGKKAIFCKWVYKIKYKNDGSVERNKARLVVCGNRQVQGVDYGETFAPVAKMVTVRTILAVAAHRHWELHHMDVDNAFLHGDLHEEVYINAPAPWVYGCLPREGSSFTTLSLWIETGPSMLVFQIDHFVVCLWIRTV